jgi:hypothetical protein
MQVEKPTPQKVAGTKTEMTHQGMHSAPDTACNARQHGASAPANSGDDLRQYRRVAGSPSTQEHSTGAVGSAQLCHFMRRGLRVMFRIDNVSSILSTIGPVKSRDHVAMPTAEQ